MKNYKNLFPSIQTQIPKKAIKNENNNISLQSIQSHESSIVPTFSNISRLSQSGYFAACGDIDEKYSDNQSLSSNSTGQFGITKAVDLCCRTYFTENQIISQPESDICQFKAYTFPFNKVKIDIILKTICGFLNLNGGHIYIGIEENILTKQHKVSGQTYNEAEKEDVLRLLRVTAQSIQPDILANNKMKICFVPVKSCVYPYSYIAGRFVIKMQIFAGVRDQIYTMKNEDGEHFLCIRTENEILTYDVKKELRKILQIQRQRIQNPLPIPRKLHKYECRKPEQGIRVFEQQNRMFIKRKGKQDGEEGKKNMKEGQRRVKQTKKQQKPRINIDNSNSININSFHINSNNNNNDNERYKQLGIGLSDNKNKSKIKNNKKREKMQQLNNQKQEQKPQTNGYQIAIDKMPKICYKQIKKQNELNKCLSNIVKQKNINEYGSILLDCLDRSGWDSQKTISRSKSVKYQQTNMFMGNDRQKINSLFKENKELVYKLIREQNCGEQKHNHGYQSQVVKYFCGFAKCNPGLTTYDFIQFAEELKGINYLNHRFVALRGYSKKKILMILSQFKNAGHFSVFDLQTIIVFRFSNNKTGDKGLQQALERSMSYQIDYFNTSAKRNKKSLIFQNDEHPMLSNTVLMEQRKSQRSIIKLSTNLRIKNYAVLSKQLKDRIIQRMKRIQGITRQSCLMLKGLKKNVDRDYYGGIQFEFKNICNSLIGYLELKQFQIQLIFC